MIVLVLGKYGMLGSMLYKYLNNMGINVAASQRNKRNEPFYLNVHSNLSENSLVNHFPKTICYIINCIGATKFDRTHIESFQRRFYVNAFFPHLLQKFCQQTSIRIINMSTDAVFKGRDTPYYEDDTTDGIGDYAISKIVGEIFSVNVLNIRCSIIGPELNRQRHLMEWFLALKDGQTIKGYTDYIWNGITTLQFSELCYQIIKQDLFDKIVSQTHVLHFSPNLPLSKFDLLTRIKAAYDKQVQIEPANSGQNIKLILKSNFEDLFGGRYTHNNDIGKEIVRMKAFTRNPYKKGIDK